MNVSVLALENVFDTGLAVVLDAFQTANELAELSGLSSSRFDVTVVRRTKEFRHFTVGGELEIESVEVLAEDVQSVSCRWCGATDDAIETLTG